MKKIIYRFIFFNIFCIGAFSQEKKVIIPIPIEFMAGNNRFDFQTQINKGFSTSSKFSFPSITSLAASYDNDVKDFDFINASQVSYDFYKGFGISSGITMSAQSGFSPTTGLQYVYAAKKILVVVAPGILLTNNQSTSSFCF